MRASVMMLALVLACALSVPASGAQLRADPLAAKSHNPVARVVEMLKDLSAKVAAEGKAEEALYEDFVCWGQSVISGKTASNEAAEARIKELEQWIADLDSGKTELTSERTDLEKDIQTLEEEKESATSERKQEEKDFALAEEDMTLAIAALKKAIQVLATATKEGNKTSLVSIRAKVSSGMAQGGVAALKKQAAILEKALDLGDRYLHRADANFLRRLLTGDVPVVDWKKLNRKATFRMKYKARSGKIQETLASMLETFEKNLAEAKAKEAADKKAYDDLIADKSAQLDSAQDAYSKMAEEKGAKALSKEESQDEIDHLNDQIKADKGFISQTQDSLATKKSEWKARKALRAGELEAIAKAIHILHNDEARDLMKKSFASQGYLFFQQSATVHNSKRLHLNRARAVLRHVAAITKDSRLLAIAPFSDDEKSVIAPAITAIDNLIAKLQKDEAEDLSIKEECESERAADTREAIVAARTIDEKTDVITELTENIAELDAEIVATNESMLATQAELKKATELRDAENKEFEADLADDKLAASTVLSATDVLAKFYKDNNLMLIQQPVETVAGEAPTPPPDTWEGAYMGATGEAEGILAILSMVHEDIEKDIEKAKAEEDAAVAAFKALAKAANDAIAADKAKIIDLSGKKDDKIKDKGTTIGERATLKESLNGMLETIKNKAKDGCDYFAVNYELRRSNREIELDGLTKAKAYLQGGEFDKTDPNREIKPGDAAALLQKKRLHR